MKGSERRPQSPEESGASPSLATIATYAEVGTVATGAVPVPTRRAHPDSTPTVGLGTPARIVA